MSVVPYRAGMFSRVLLSLALVTSLIIAPTHTAQAEECSTDSCISVTADDESDEIVVSIERNSRSSTERRGEKKERSLPKTSGSFSAMADPRRTWIPYHPDIYAAWREAARKAAATRKRNRPTSVPVTSRQVVSTSLSDRVRQLIPIGGLHFQPPQGAIVGRPVFFWSNTPTSFDVTIRVAGLPVRLELTPSFEWSYGDGTTRTTSLPGAPYPVPLNTYTYEKAGVREVRLVTTWSGAFTVSGVKSPIEGVIRQVDTRSLDVRTAPHRALG